MPFNVALSGIRAASSDLSVTGNNIANASTTGFKSSRAEFGDVYATSVLGSGGNAIGNGVRLQDVAQQFTQGSVSFTGGELDLAVNGTGFFVVQSGGEQFYTRAGAFSVDQEGYIVNNVDARLQGFQADGTGNVSSGIQGDIQIQTGNLSPRLTSGVSSLLNLDSSEPILQDNGNRYTTDGRAIAETAVGLSQSTRTTYNGATLAGLGGTPDFSAPTNDAVTFNITLSGVSPTSATKAGTVAITLDTAAGLPGSIATFNDLKTVASVINAQIFNPTAPGQTAIDVQAEAVEVTPGNFELQFTSLRDGESSQITLDSVELNAAATAGASVFGLTNTSGTSGVARVGNGYEAQTLDITAPDGTVDVFSSAEGDSAASIATSLNAFAGVTATARTQMVFEFPTAAIPADNLVVNLNGIDFPAASFTALRDSINQLTGSTLPGISATVEEATGNLVVTSQVGEDLRVSISSTDTVAPLDGLSVFGRKGDPVTDTTPQLLQLGGVGTSDATSNSIVVGGEITMTLSEGYVAGNPSTPFVGLYSDIATDQEAFTLNQFDPTDQSTYNSATSMTIFDSQGNSHILTQYFVKQDYDPADPASNANEWTMYVQVDGRDVGDPDTTLAPPENTLATRAAYPVVFNEDGSLNTAITGPNSILISNWQPLDPEGADNGSLGPVNALAGGNGTPDDPPTDSNFQIDLSGTTQFGSAFSVNDVDQDGFTTGRLSGLNIDDTGVIFARYTNGESQTLAQLVLSDFANTQGLQPVGDSMWAENFDSGPPNIGTPGSAALGAVQAGALEESNVDLSEELVALIIAQRNFQASAKTIETANQVTQTIINLR